MPEQTHDLQAWVQEFAGAAMRDEAVERFVRHVNDGILDQIPQLAEDPMLTHDLYLSTRSQWRAFLEMVRTEDYRHQLPLPAGNLARSLARRGMDLGILLKIYRAAHQFVLTYLSEVTQEPPLPRPGRDEALVHLWSRAGHWIDDTIEQLIETFYEERRAQVQGALARRAALVDGLLQGTMTATEELSGDLGHALRHWQTGFVLWQAEGPVQERDLDALAQELARVVGAPPPLVHAAGHRDRWGWLATPTSPDLSAAGGLGQRLGDAGARLSLGLPHRGPVGFRRSHQEARAAHRLSSSALLAPPVLGYRDVELLCLVDGNRDLVERMVLREVGPLCGADKNLAQVRQTILAFLTHRQVEAVAEELFVHKNTVRYRLGKAEELLGHPLTERAAYVELALRHVALFGPPVDEDR
ncbi:PucR family transcriptional regulator [Nocardioides insulae]|uniref:PucR family transcriptional regulator n=1 Tax=Nocardioides insulae TaxID=394734 RepID=UPI0004094E6E|nr:helix-turn-helix domain-containing protein [Nocardioides insulae]